MRLRQKFIAAALAVALTAVSFNTDALALGRDTITHAQLLGILVSAYEFFAGEEVDESGITSKLSTEKSMRKALELGLINDYEVSWAHLPVTRQSAAACLLALKNAMRTRLYGSATQQADVSSAADELAAALKICGIITDMPTALRFTECMDGNLPLTRAGLCEVLVRTYEGIYGEIDLGNIKVPEDTDSAYVLKALTCGFMRRYEVSNTFEPDAPVQLRQLAAPILRMAARDERTREGMERAEVRRAAAELIMSFVGMPRAGRECTEKLNEVGWNWYVNQLNTGQYSANNCMPACGEMVLNYIDRENKTSAAMLRALSPHEGEGWYDVEFFDVMADCGVKLESEYDMCVQNMLRDIDDGHILVVMCNFEGNRSGHAMVVFGYERIASGTWFICNDPESSATDKYGKPDGYMRRVEAQELVMAMKRHVPRYFRVMN